MLPLRDDVLDRMACALPSDAQSNVCLGTVVLTLIMLALAITLAVGISLRQSKYILPWLIMSTVTVVVIIIYLIIYGNIFLTIMGGLVLFLVILSWYPSLKLYQRFRTEQDIEMQQYPAEESRPLYHLPPSASLPLYSEVVRDPLQMNTMEPPSYDEVITMKMKPIDSLDI
ncbi:uncharacterized protein LOC131801711 isoform X2 [Musca domestica]|uniref:Uncharacterized protein LOC105261494 isoform X2 n=1 Tax=Musca domestica TaxID=7370 RepID=A0A1I8NL67_MUSDO|nr:uncharacterized protein LOC105261494 isoform X2 [Musca domestica]XP_058976627.1 uncharacterized protein LOC131801711 isoform X2 [Musca domestica]